MNKKNIIFIFIFIIILYIIYYSIEFDEYFLTSIYKRTLDKDGFIILYDKEYTNINTIPTNKLIDDVLKKLPKNYIFLDYYYKIENTVLSTFHRDVTSSQYLFKTKYPVYTLILYKYDGCLLSVCPGSHNTYPFVNSHILNINGYRGTCFLINSELLHAGCNSSCEKRELIQYKICHKDDFEKLNNLNGIHIIKKNIINNNCGDILNKIARKTSYFFEFPINYIFNPLLIKKNDGIIGKIQDYVPLKFYNNT
jgi:hypothetical protein